jgi:bifunctional non-homologous end joining protein LigD
MRDETLQIRKRWLGKLLKRSGDGSLLNEHEAGAIGPRLFEHGCNMGLEGIVSKHRERGYSAGRGRHIGSRSNIRTRRQWFAPRMTPGNNP